MKSLWLCLLLGVLAAAESPVPKAADDDEVRSRT
jgi:hypothetical protein